MAHDSTLATSLNDSQRRHPLQIQSRTRRRRRPELGQLGPPLQCSVCHWLPVRTSLLPSSHFSKRLYRQILSYPLPAPHHPLSTSTLPEPAFSAVVKAPTSPDGLAGLVQLARMVLCLAVWAPGNDKVIAKIQSLGDAHMAELMRGIEEVMGSMPPEESGEGDETASVGASAAGGRGGGVRRVGSVDWGSKSRASSKRSSPEKKSQAR